MVRAGDDGLGRHRDHRIEIARGQRVAQIAEIIGEECLHQREVGAERDFEQIALAVHLDALLAGLDRRADAGLRQNAAEPVSAGADAFDERTLRHQLDLQLAGQHLPLRFGIEANVAHDRLAHQLGRDQLADARGRHRGIVGDHRQIALVLPHDFVDDALGRADGHEAADHQACAIGDHGNRLIERESA